MWASAAFLWLLLSLHRCRCLSCCRYFPDGKLYGVFRLQQHLISSTRTTSKFDHCSHIHMSLCYHSTTSHHPISAPSNYWLSFWVALLFRMASRHDLISKLVVGTTGNTWPSNCFSWIMFRTWPSLFVAWTMARSILFDDQHIGNINLAPKYPNNTT